MRSMKNHKGTTITFLVFACIGFLDAAFLTAERFLKGTVPCSLTGGCEIVLTSRYATVLGIPTALYGAVYYLLLLFLAFISVTRNSESYIRIASYITVPGLIVSTTLLFLQLFVIKAICIYCILSAIVSYALFILGITIVKNPTQQRKNTLQ